jgi:thiaminase
MNVFSIGIFNILSLLFVSTYGFLIQVSTYQWLKLYIACNTHELREIVNHAKSFRNVLPCMHASFLKNILLTKNKFNSKMKPTQFSFIKHFMNCGVAYFSY